MKPQTIWTIGHSTHEPEIFSEMLRKNNIERLIDIRSFPGSRRCPQFNKEAMETWIPQLVDIPYIHIKKLGGLRKLKPNPINDAWRNKSFHSYADYMQSDDFKEGLLELSRFAELERCAIMCAESVPWRCHRSLVSDAMIAHGWNVLDIFSKTMTKEHVIKPFAKVDSAGNVVYPKTDECCNHRISLFDE